MMKLTCGCGASLDLDTGPSIEVLQSKEWLDRHQECADTFVANHVSPNARAVWESERDARSNWPSGFDFLRNAPGMFRQAIQGSNIHCMSCNYAQPLNGPEQHADDCPNKLTNQ